MRWLTVRVPGQPGREHPAREARPTSGYYGNTSGADVTVLLPNSRLILPVQLVGYYMAIDRTTQGSPGIRPDYPVAYSIDDILTGRDRAMELALRQAGETAPIR